MRQPAMRAILLAPLIEQAQDRIDFGGYQLVDAASGAGIGQLIGVLFEPPALNPAGVDQQHPTGPQQ